MNQQENREQIELVDEDQIGVVIASTESGVELDTRPWGKIELTPHQIDQAIGFLQRQADRVRNRPVKEQMGLFERSEAV